MKRAIPIPRTTLDALLEREWLVTNGRGAYAAGSIAGVPTRRFHGLLVAALPPPIGRAMMLSELAETLRLPSGRVVQLAGYEHFERPTRIENVLRELALEDGLPVWRFEIDGFLLEKRIHLVHLQNTVVASYRLLEGPGAIELELRPFVSFRPHEGPVTGPEPTHYRLTSEGNEHEIQGPAGFPHLRLLGPGRLLHEVGMAENVLYRIERARGYDWLGTTWSPGRFVSTLAPGTEAALVASTESWDDVRVLHPVEARAAETLRRKRLLQTAGVPDALGELVLAADAFVIRPDTRRADAVRATAAGDELRSVIAGYHWFTDWGRDTMISLEGLTLTTGRYAEAGYILRTFARYVKDGLIPNLFPEGKTAGLYHTADATLWFFHAVERYLAYTNDRLTLRFLLPTLREIAQAHLRGTHFGIRVDPADGLLAQGADGYQLTWMDAKVDGWVVTPRRGKAVEINALWFNALALLAGWLKEEGLDAGPFVAAAARARAAFNARFWNEAQGCLYDVIDGPGIDAAVRPNQIFAISLLHPVLEPSRWKPVLDVVERELLTPVGLRSLSRSHPDYARSYDGDLRARDAAYHQGTVWSWLIGPFVDAWLRVHPERRSEAARFLEGFGPHLDEACLGSVSEIFDAEPPFRPRGCVAQAWGVAELLRASAKVARSG